MKPIVVKTNDNEHILMTLSEFNKIIEQVYNEGFKDGQKDKDNSPYIHCEPYLPNCPNSNDFWHLTSTNDVTTIDSKSLPKLYTDSRIGLVERP